MDLFWGPLRPGNGVCWASTRPRWPLLRLHARLILQRSGPHLELPLGGHDLRVDARDVDAGKHAGLEVGLHDVAADGCARAGGAIVGALGAWKAVAGPAQGPLGGCVQDAVLLRGTGGRRLCAHGAGCPRLRPEPPKADCSALSSALPFGLLGSGAWSGHGRLGQRRGGTCSMPNQGSSSRTFSMAFMHALRVLVGRGVKGTLGSSPTLGGM